MSAIKYHQLAPQNDNQNGFSQFSQITFELGVDGRLLKPNSICLDFELEAESAAGTRVVNTDAIRADHVVGMHSFIGDITVENPSGQLEHINEYPRFYKSVKSLTEDSGSVFSLMAQAEGRDAIADAANSRLQLLGSKSTDGKNAAFATSAFRQPNYSIKPLCCLNRTVAVQGAGYSFSDNGNITLTFSLQRDGLSFYGQDMTANSSYRLKNVKLRFSTIPDPGASKRPKLVMNSVVNVKQTAQSQQTSIDARVPAAACNGVIMNFLRQDKEGNLVSNNNALEQFPLLDRISYRLNDSVSGYITYDLETREEFVNNALKVMGDAGFNQVHARNIWSGENYIIGASFDRYISLEQNKFTVDLHSSSNNLSAAGRGYIAYLYFMTLITV